MAREFGVTLAVTEDDNITSLQVARGVQTHLDLNDRPAVAASASGPDADVLWGASFDRGLEERGAAKRPQVWEWPPRLHQPKVAFSGARGLDPVNSI
ncbi:unnamed protein product [Lampetra fluviatilis]